MTEPEVPQFSHEQVELAYGAHTVHVDAGLAILLPLLWDQGFGTQFSCQGGLEPGTQSEAGGQAQPSQFAIPAMFGGDPAPLSDAHVLFEHYIHAVEFMARSLRSLGTPWVDDPDSDYVYYPSQMSMQVLHPIDGAYDMRGDVQWRHNLTPELIRVWT